MKLIALFFALAAALFAHYGDAYGTIWMLLISGLVLLARWRMRQGERGQPWRLTRRA
jgi:hypothetical protein